MGVRRRIIDAGISGTKEASQYRLQAHAVQASELNAVIVLALDRLRLNTRLVFSPVDTFAAANVAIVSCQEGLDTSTPRFNLY